MPANDGGLGLGVVTFSGRLLTVLSSWEVPEMGAGRRRVEMHWGGELDRSDEVVSTVEAAIWS